MGAGGEEATTLWLRPAPLSEVRAGRAGGMRALPGDWAAPAPMGEGDGGDMTEKLRLLALVGEPRPPIVIDFSRRSLSVLSRPPPPPRDTAGGGGEEAALAD